MNFLRRLIRWITGADKARDEYEWWMAPVIEHEPFDLETAIRRGGE